MKGHAAIRGALTLEFADDPDCQVVILVDEGGLVYGAIEYDWLRDYGLGYWWADPAEPATSTPICDPACGCMFPRRPGLAHVRACVCDACPITRGEVKAFLAASDNSAWGAV